MHSRACVEWGRCCVGAGCARRATICIRTTRTSPDGAGVCHRYKHVVGFPFLSLCLCFVATYFDTYDEPVQTTLTFSHAILLASQLMRNHLTTMLTVADSRAAAIFSDACATYYVRQCHKSIDALALCVGASSLVNASGFPAMLRDVRALLFVAGHPSRPLQSLAQWLTKGYALVNRKRQSYTHSYCCCWFLLCLTDVMSSR